MPIRPQGTPTWLQILNQSAQTTAQNAAIISDQMDSARQARAQSEQMKMNAMESAYQLQQQDRQISLREKQVLFEMDSKARSQTLDEITTALDIERQSRIDELSRAEILSKNYLGPLLEEYQRMEFNPLKEEEAKALKEKIDKVKAAVDPIFIKAANINPNEVDPATKANALLDSFGLARMEVEKYLGPNERDIIFKGAKGGENLVIPGQGPQQIQSTLLPDSQQQSQPNLSNNQDPTTYEDLNFFYNGGNNTPPPGAIIENGAGSFDLGQKKTNVNVVDTVAYPTSSPIPAPSTIQTASQSTVTEAPVIDSARISSTHSKAESIMNAANASGRYTPEVKANVMSWIDREVGPENNRFRKESFERVENLGKLVAKGDMNESTAMALMKDEAIVLGASTVRDVYVNSLTGTSQQAREVARQEEMRKEQQARIDARATAPERLSTALEQVSKVRQQLAAKDADGVFILDDSTISTLNEKVLPQLQNEINSIIAEMQGGSNVEIPGMGQSNKGSADSLIVDGALRFNDSILSQSGVDEKGKLYLSDGNPNSTKSGANPDLAKSVENLIPADLSNKDESSKFVESRGNLSFDKLANEAFKLDPEMSKLGVSVDFSGARAIDTGIFELFDSSTGENIKKITSELSNKYAKEFDSLSESRKRELAIILPVELSNSPIDVVGFSGAGVGKGLSVKERFIAEKVKKSQDKIYAFVKNLEGAYLNKSKKDRTEAADRYLAP